MSRTMLRAKLHRATVTEALLEYEGSLTVDRDLLDAVGHLPNEQIHEANITNGERFVTYLFEGERQARPGDQLIIMAYGLVDEEEAETHQPKVAILNETNHIALMV
jgi:aspartate 1-decarboxylase